MNRACFTQNTTELASSALPAETAVQAGKLNLYEQNQHAVPIAIGSIRPLKNNFVRMKHRFKTLLIVLFSVSTSLLAQQVTAINPELLSKPWAAQWISFPENS